LTAPAPLGCSAVPSMLGARRVRPADQGVAL